MSLEARVKRQILESAGIKKKIAEGQVQTVLEIARILTEALRRGNCVYIMGNGGSAADAQHIAAELVGRFERERKAFAAVALTTDTSVMSSVANDYGFEEIFRRQVEGLVREGDVVLALSTSGKSRNVIIACKEARKRGAKVVGFSGRGGDLKEIADVCLTVPSDVTARVQEVHITVAHVVCGIVEEELSKDVR